MATAALASRHDNRAAATATSRRHISARASRNAHGTAGTGRRGRVAGRKIQSTGGLVTGPSTHSNAPSGAGRGRAGGDRDAASDAVGGSARGQRDGAGRARLSVGGTDEDAAALAITVRNGAGTDRHAARRSARPRSVTSSHGHRAARPKVGGSRADHNVTASAGGAGACGDRHRA